MDSTSRNRPPGPRPRDELAAGSTAAVDTDPIPAIPGLAEPSPPGWWESVDGRGVYLRRWSGPEVPRSRPVWCVHGLAGSSTNWNRLAAALSDRGDCVAVDLPGHGWSDPPPRDDYDLPAQARLLADLIDRVSGGPVHLVGNSYGGVIATMVAAIRPDLVLTLSLISPAVPDLRLLGERGADPRIGVLMVPGTMAPAVRHLSRVDAISRARALAEVCFGRPDRVSAAALASAAAEVRDREALPWVHTSTIGAVRALMGWYLRPGRSGFRSMAARIAVPVLVVWGTRDRLVDVRLAETTVAAFPDARSLLIAGSGHVAQMEDPEPTARALRALIGSHSAAGGHTGGDLGEAGAPGRASQEPVAGSFP